VISAIDGNATALLKLALDATGMRHQALANNIANANTPGYQRMSVSFEGRMAALKDASGHVSASALADLASFRPVIEYAEAGAPIALDTEVAQLSENTLHHQALLKALSKHYALIGMAINEGKR
jgi:flagellar basal-body rod protein FlgB